MENFETVSEAIDGLRKQGYTEDFNLNTDCLKCSKGIFKLYHDEFKVDKYYRFEGMTDPGDEAVVYAISSDKHKVKGVLVNAYGIYADDIADELVHTLNVLHKEE